MKLKTKRYYAREYRPGHWDIIDMETNYPVYDDHPYDDRHLVYTDEDRVDLAVKIMNEQAENEKE